MRRRHIRHGTVRQNGAAQTAIFGAKEREAGTPPPLLAVADIASIYTDFHFESPASFIFFSNASFICCPFKYSIKSRRFKSFEGTIDLTVPNVQAALVDWKCYGLNGSQLVHLLI